MAALAHAVFGTEHYRRVLLDPIRDRHLANALFGREGTALALEWASLDRKSLATWSDRISAGAPTPAEGMTIERHPHAPEPGDAVQVTNVDEFERFLLIEAANHLSMTPDPTVTRASLATEDQDPAQRLEPREWTYVESAFSPEECKALLEVALTRPRAPARVGPDRRLDPELRQCEVAPIERSDPEFADVFTRLDELVEKANRECFGVRYHPVRKLQLTVYQSDDADHYGPHSDTRLPNAALTRQRKLSVILQLSDPADYEGGDLRMHHLETEPPEEPLRRQGTLIVFPSLLRHEVLPVTSGTRVSLVGWCPGPRWQ